MIPWTISSKGHNDQRTLRAAAILYPPRPDMSWSNVAVDSSSAIRDTARITVFWQPCTGGSQPCELYLYDVPRCVGSETPASAGEGSGISPGPFSETERNERRQFPIHIPGKRVGSLHPMMWGVHPLSPLYPSGSAATSRLNAGGLCLYFSPPVNRYTTQHSAPHSIPQNCAIWGPSSSGSPSEHELIILDFGRSASCGCELHDEVIRITMPNPGLSSPPDYKISSPAGTIEYARTPAQEEAEARTKEVLKNRIRELVKNGLNAEEILDMWGNAS